MKKYLPRICDEILDFKLKSKGAVLIKGPKWCGKSTTAMQKAKSSIFLQDKKNQEQNILLAKNAPDIFLSGETPRLIDEWQLIPFIWDSIRYEIDKRNEFGQFIITGFATPTKLNQYDHSGIGRITNMIMRPMSLYESGDSDGSTSLKGLFENKFSSSKTDKTLRDYAFLTCRGGWPSAIVENERIALQQSIDYFDGLVYSDISSVDGVKRDIEKVKLFMRTYSRHISTQASIKTMKDDMQNLKIDEDTISSYIKVLQNLFVIEEVAAYSPNIRSKTVIRTKNTRHFIDPSIACASLGIGPNDLINDLNTFGLLFESLCVRDLRIFADSIDGSVYHYRDSNGFEIDSIVHLRNGDWGAFEIKLASDETIDIAAKNLLKFFDNIDETKTKKPKFLCVLTATNISYQREDGVYVVPLTCLKN